jgi:hypothetical protein
MDARTQALAVDFTLAVLAVALGVLGNGLVLALATPPLVVFGLGLLVGPLYLTEHSRFLETLDENSPVSFLAVFVAMFVLTLVVVAGRTVVPAPVATLLFGMGVGLASYRTVYGVVRPLPERRLTQARWLSGSDESGLNPP